MFSETCENLSLKIFSETFENLRLQMLVKLLKIFGSRCLVK